MGTGRTLRKESHVRPCKTPAGKAEEEVKLMSTENVRVLVQRPAVVKKMLAKRAAAK